MKTCTIYVRLPEESVVVWAPVDAEHIREDIYRILDCRGEDDETQFKPGDIVRCRVELLAQEVDPEPTLAAVEHVAQ
jgi:hypothetical protein